MSVAVVVLHGSDHPMHFAVSGVPSLPFPSGPEVTVGSHATGPQLPPGQNYSMQDTHRDWVLMSSSPALESDLAGVPREQYGADYAAHILDQYRLYVEMADNLSKRRQDANTYMLTANTVLAAILGLVNGVPARTLSYGFLVVGAIAGVALSFTWYQLIVSYRQLNAAKFQVVHAIERRLPVRPYDAEWSLLGRGTAPNLYRPFTSVETTIPILFVLLYLALLGIALGSAFGLV